MKRWLSILLVVALQVLPTGWLCALLCSGCRVAVCCAQLVCIPEETRASCCGASTDEGPGCCGSACEAGSTRNNDRGSEDPCGEREGSCCEVCPDWWWVAPNALKHGSSADAGIVAWLAGSLVGLVPSYPMPAEVAPVEIVRPPGWSSAWLTIAESGRVRALLCCWTI